MFFIVDLSLCTFYIFCLLSLTIIRPPPPQVFPTSNSTLCLINNEPENNKKMLGLRQNTMLFQHVFFILNDGRVKTPSWFLLIMESTSSTNDIRYSAAMFCSHTKAMWQCDKMVCMRCLRKDPTDSYYCLHSNLKCLFPLGQGSHEHGCSNMNEWLCIGRVWSIISARQCWWY